MISPTMKMRDNDDDEDEYDLLELSTNVPEHSWPFYTACGLVIGMSQLRCPLHLQDNCLRGETDLSNSYWWTGVYRVVIVRKNTDSHPEKAYQLSGAAVIDRYVGTNFEVPLDKTRRSKRYRMMMPLRSNKSLFSVPPGQLYGGGDVGLPVCGFAIHDHCWDLLTLVLGPDTETHLDLLLQAMLERRSVIGKFFLYARTCREWAVIPLDIRSQRFVVSKFPAYDPICVPGFRSSIRESIRSELNGQTSSPQATTSTCQVELPLDIQRLILDSLNHRDANNLLRAFGWRVHDQYWQRRFPKALRLDIQDLDPSAIQDWTQFCLQAEAMLESDKRLISRQRILDTFDDLGERFWPLVEARLAEEAEAKVT